MPDESVAVAMTTDVTDWQAVARDLANALRTTMLRNPNLAARDWDIATAALARYDGSVRGVMAGVPEASAP
jgi:hypothetical protein